MPLYETVFLVRQDLSGQAVDDLVEAYKTVIAENGGSVGRTENWGLKTLAYRIEKNRKAHFALMDIDVRRLNSETAEFASLTPDSFRARTERMPASDLPQLTLAPFEVAILAARKPATP